MTNTQSTIRDAILIMLDQAEEIHGTDALARTLNTDKPWLIRSVRVMERRGQLTIIPSRGGRGNRTVYKRNRNSSGQPRKKAP